MSHEMTDDEKAVFTAACLGRSINLPPGSKVIVLCGFVRREFEAVTEWSHTRTTQHSRATFSWHTETPDCVVWYKILDDTGLRYCTWCSLVHVKGIVLPPGVTSEQVLKQESSND